MAQHELVERERWLTPAQFLELLSLGQALPGPNVLFVAVIGWNVAGLSGVAATLGGSLLPCTALGLAVARLGARLETSRCVRAFSAGLAPLTLGLLLATDWVLTDPVRDSLGVMLLVPFTVAVLLRFRLSPIWLVALGVVVGALGGAG